MFCSNLATLLRELPGFAVRSLTGNSGVILLQHRVAVGDALMLTALARGLKKFSPKTRVSVVTRFPRLFLNNPNIDESRDWHLWRTRYTVRAHYSGKKLTGSEHAVNIRWRGMWSELYEKSFPGAAGPDSAPEMDGVHPEMFLTDSELKNARERFGKSGKPIVLVSSGGKLIPTHNREWGMANYQSVVDALAPHVTLLQVSGDQRLSARGTLLEDLRRIDLREAAALFSICAASLVQEGGLMHLARAVNAPTVVIFGGYVLPEQTGYADQVNLWAKPECSPCIVTAKNCAHLKCMVGITPRRVLECIAKLMKERCDFVLPSEVVESVPAIWTPPEFVDRGVLESELAKGASWESG